MTESIDAIVVNYNAGNLLQTCIASLNVCPVVSKVIVVDNFSHDDSLRAIQHLPGVQIIKNNKNFGFAAACNMGIEKTDADYLLFLNPDCSFLPGTMSRIVEHMRADSAIGMAGGVLINPGDGTEQAGGRRAIPTPWRSFVRAFGLHRYANRWPRLFYDFCLHDELLPGAPVAVEAISGACMLVKREAIDDVGLWDEGYFLHCEDLDWCMRFRQKGWKILFIPDAKIIHQQGACSRSRPFFVEWHKHKGMLRFYRKFFRHQYPGILMWLVTFGVWFRFFLVAGYYLAKRMLDKL
ncbi:dTDP-Rha--alpha-D-GlcNAc-pyrophosphate polyprenol alpha-3-L-rhamnosyltransferase [Methylomonas sp. LWB]|uniref:glycosyltransferase family 2 protein n=1 Tax=Methylomonas sp. LWB TaxID=1905845 RepID=UPI0008D9A9D8|nr:glycosyltransferase family 2 protein [Methylomonas sp. LWB]OHX35246.1 dTDP-Rha--alpha-D-GlcNAc-pyrophosphate polyprenol alpha-3-L-rhamnosyltransferase [Methylomonas sp. LWB]